MVTRSLRRRGRAMVIPSAPAVLRLSVRSYLVGACTGRFCLLLAPEDPIDVARRESVLLDPIGGIGDQSAVAHKDTVPVDCRQSLALRQSDDQLAMSE